jgi:N-acetylmuramoyl-L-alanine amidase
MHPLFIYISKVIVCSGILTGYYWLFLRNKVFHQYNRFYLLAITFISILLPLIRIHYWEPATAELPVIKMMQTIESNQLQELDNVHASTANVVDWQQILVFIYVLIGLAFLVIFLKGLYKIGQLYITNKKDSIENIQLIQTEANGTPFSFLSNIFWNKNIDLSTSTGQLILKHEIAHIQQKHSHDKIWINLLLIVYWINPFFWLIKNELSMIHEFVADKKAVDNGDTAAFAAMVLKATYPTQQFALTNNFFYSPIKRRIMMITKNTPKSINYISRLMVLPIAAFVFVALAFKPLQQPTTPKLEKQYTIVIDAGHGGKDFGAASASGLYEKDMALQLAKKIKALNSNNNIKILLTRETDIYQSPKEKAELVNAYKADLMIAIHLDGAPKDSFDKKSGMSFWVPRNEYKNTPASKILANTLIQSFDKDYALTFISNTPMQRPTGVWILQATNCPAVLVEAGFITTKTDIAFLQSDEGQIAFAKNMLNGIYRYCSLTETEKTALLESPQKVTEKIVTPEKSPNKQPLIVIDDVVSNKAALDKIPTDEIEIINVINAASALKIYGEKGKHGATVIYTKNCGKEFDKEKALIVIDGTPVADKNSVKEKLANSTQNESITVLSPCKSVAKYGKKGEFGAYEIVHKATADSIKLRYPTNTDPVYVLNGKIITKAEMDMIDPNSIATINVLKGEQANKLYGIVGKNGIIEIIQKANIQKPSISLKPKRTIDL